MSNHITVIDIEVGHPEKGFAIRVGKENPPQQRFANCIAWDSVKNDIGWTVPLYKYATNQEYTQWNSLDAAIKAATSYRNARYPTYKIRVDATIG
jgi:hypothetical protein